MHGNLSDINGEITITDINFGALSKIIHGIAEHPQKKKRADHKNEVAEN